jgi:hypothetical protein
VAEQNVIQWAAKRAADEPRLLGHELREYRTLKDATEDDVATALECSRDALICLALCRRPDPSAPSFRADVEQIALHCGVNAQRLAVLLREVDSLRAIRQVPIPPHLSAAQPGLLAAARDRKKKRRGQKAGGKKRPAK